MNSGAYQLIIEVKEPVDFVIKSLGNIELEPGLYIYTGSALKNLKQRLDRHYRKEKKIHWHIDYLLAQENVEIIEHHSFESDSKIECNLNQKILNLENSWVPIEKFGSTDCNRCPSHLIGIKRFSKNGNRQEKTNRSF